MDLPVIKSWAFDFQCKHSTTQLPPATTSPSYLMYLTCSQCVVGCVEVATTILHTSICNYHCNWPSNLRVFSPADNNHRVQPFDGHRSWLLWGSIVVQTREVAAWWRQCGYQPFSSERFWLWTTNVLRYVHQYNLFCFYSAPMFCNSLPNCCSLIIQSLFNLLVCYNSMDQLFSCFKFILDTLNVHVLIS